jgi:hypothetical protein
MDFFNLVKRHVRVHGGEQGWLDGQILLSLILLNLAGGDCPEDIERLENDKGLCKAMMHLEKRLLGDGRHKRLSKRWSRKRCGNSEQFHSVMKGELCGGKLPSGKFGANACWWQVMIMALNLHEMLKRLTLPAEWHNRRPKALRYWFINAAGCVVKSGRQKGF